ncbi:hypothetical protein P3X46_004522 [Hevea brasiliensis]|uniref:Kinesin motor domain-containing protein n=1 Tax=Hevea brasiliensis TaxID=3981 RepID=A0ABQ9MZN3_HEVBR|nr:hypothetical protein P3X46_004522 [Hevea brasiliensis]
MENCATAGLHDTLTSRKAEEAAAWLESLVGPLGISGHPSEKVFISRLRNGLILCNAINKVHPGAVPKVVENHTPLQSQPLPAYQYFENVRNFLVAVEELKVPAFETSDLERGNLTTTLQYLLELCIYDTLEAGSAAKVVDCILALKLYNECKQINGGNGFYKSIRSPMVMHPANVNNSQSLSSDSCRRLDMPATSEKQPPANVEIQKLSDFIAKLLIEHMADTKENINDNLLMSFRTGNMDKEKVLSKIMVGCFEDKLQNNFPENFLKERSKSQAHSTLVPSEDSSKFKDYEDLKSLLTKTKTEFEDLQSMFQTDLRELRYQLQEMSAAALEYHRVLKENRNLCNMVQDLKGNIRVYCRIRPAITGKKSNVIYFVGKDGSLVILDPLKPRKDGRKKFQFNQVFGPTATQDEVYNDTQPLIRSVMDGYNVCIFAYGQTGLGKTYTMSGPSGGSIKDMGINYMALNDLFQISKERKEVINYDIQVQMVEIYNEQVRDLLSGDTSATKYPFTFLEIWSCSGDSGLSLPDARMYTVMSTTDVFNLMKLGEVNRVVSSTAVNHRSSGHAKTLMFARVSPEGDSFGQTISTLQFAQRVSTVELGAARVNKESSEIMQLKEQVENLRKALASKQPRSLPEKPKAVSEQTPPRMWRLSIENGSNMKSQTVNLGDRKGSKTPSLPNRSRRLSLEGPRYSKKDNFQEKVAPDDISMPSCFEAVTLLKYGQSQDPEAKSKMNGHSSFASSTMQVYNLPTTRSPSSSYRKRSVKTHCRTQIPLKNNLISSANGKGSQIKKSLQTIGKLINGSEKRAMRRQSLTGFQASGSNRSHDSRRNTRTYPPDNKAMALTQDKVKNIQ